MYRANTKISLEDFPSRVRTHLSDLIGPAFAIFQALHRNGFPFILLGSYLPGKPRSLLFRHLFAILKAAKSSGPPVLLHARRTM
jgi:hypothetical protein